MTQSRGIELAGVQLTPGGQGRLATTDDEIPDIGDFVIHRDARSLLLACSRTNALAFARRVAG